MNARRFLRDSIGFAASQYFVRFLLTLRGLVAARLLGPGGYGDWSALMLLMDYGSYAPASTFPGLDRAVPAAIVDGDAQRLERIKRAGLFNIVVATGAFVTACTTYFARSTGQIRDAWGLAGVLVGMLCVVLTALSHYHLNLLRAHGNFSAVSMWFVLQGTIGAVLGVVLIPELGAWGLLWGWFAGTLVAALIARWRGRPVVPMLPAPSRDSLALITTGFPMFVYTVSSFVMRSLDRIIILRFLGTEALGLYGLAVMALGFLLTLPDALAYVLYPQLVRRFREGGDAPDAIRGHVHRTWRALSLLMPALCALAYLAADDVVEWLLPEFRHGVPALRILCFSAAGLSLANLASIVLMTLRRQVQLLPVAAGMAVAGIGLTWYAAQAGYGIRGVAWASFTTFALNSAILIQLAESGLGGGWGSRLGILVRAFLPLAVAMPLAYVFERFFPGYGPMGILRALRLLGSAVGWLALYVLLMVPLAQGIGLRPLLRELEWPWTPAFRRRRDA